MSAAQQRFTPITDDSGAHVATRDARTGLEWAPVGSEAHDSQQDAEQAAAALDVLGGGWRLPSIDELAALVDRTRHNPAIDAEAFPFVQSDWYWSSTPAAWSSASAWYVYFSYGLVGDYHRNGYGFALACRESGQ